MKNCFEPAPRYVQTGVQARLVQVRTGDIDIQEPPR